MTDGHVDSVPIADPAAELRPIQSEVLAAISDVLESGRYILGPKVHEFEGAVADYLGVRHAIGVNSGTDALVIALRCAGVGPGDEVVVPAFTFYATAEAVSAVGATPVFADIESGSMNLDVDQFSAAIGPRTRAVIPVHLFGAPCDMHSITSLADDHQVAVIEDVAQAFGASLGGKQMGSFGKLGAFSFFPSKNLGAVGDGGLIVTDDDGLAEQARMLRAHGARRPYENELLGYNSRLDEIQAAVLTVKLAGIEEANARRRRTAQMYDAAFRGLPHVRTQHVLPDALHVYHQYTVRVPAPHRDRIRTALQLAGFETRVYYPTSIHQLPVFRDVDRRMPESERASTEVLSLPMVPYLTSEMAERIAAVMRQTLGNE